MKIVVIGAGIAGLSAAYRLREAGHVVTVFEATDRVGGRARRIKRPGYDEWIDSGTQYYHSNYRLTLRLIADLGLSSETKKIGGATRFYSSGSHSSFLVTPQSPWIKPGGLGGNLRALKLALRLLWHNRGSTFGTTSGADRMLDLTPALELTDDPFIRDYIIRMLPIIGGLAEPDVANISALQIRRLIRIILTTDYIALKRGTISLHEELALRLDVRLSSPVASLLVSGRSAKGVTLQSGDIVPADHVVVACPAPAAAEIVPETWTEVRQYLAEVAMPPAVLTHLFLDRELEKGVWTHLLPRNHNGPVQFFVDTQQKNPSGNKSGKATLQAWIVSPRSDLLIDLSDDEIVAATVRDLETIMPGAGKWVEGSEVTRFMQAIPQATVGHDRSSRMFLELVDTYEGVGFCGDYLSGGYVECAIWAAEREIRRIATR